MAIVWPLPSPATVPPSKKDLVESVGVTQLGWRLAAGRGGRLRCHVLAQHGEGGHWEHVLCRRSGKLAGPQRQQGPHVDGQHPAIFKRFAGGKPPQATPGPASAHYGGGPFPHERALSWLHRVFALAQRRLSCGDVPAPRGVRRKAQCGKLLEYWRSVRRRKVFSAIFVRIRPIDTRTIPFAGTIAPQAVSGYYRSVEGWLLPGRDPAIAGALGCRDRRARSRLIDACGRPSIKGGIPAQLSRRTAKLGAC